MPLNPGSSALAGGQIPAMDVAADGANPPFPKQIKALQWGLLDAAADGIREHMPTVGQTVKFGAKLGMHAAAHKVFGGDAADEDKDEAALHQYEDSDAPQRSFHSDSPTGGKFTSPTKEAAEFKRKVVGGKNPVHERVAAGVKNWMEEHSYPDAGDAVDGGDGSGVPERHGVEGLRRLDNPLPKYDRVTPSNIPATDESQAAIDKKRFTEHLHNRRSNGTFEPSSERGLTRRRKMEEVTRPEDEEEELRRR